MDWQHMVVGRTLVWLLLRCVAPLLVCIAPSLWRATTGLGTSWAGGRTTTTPHHYNAIPTNRIIVLQRTAARTGTPYNIPVRNIASIQRRLWQTFPNGFKWSTFQTDSNFSGNFLVYKPNCLKRVWEVGLPGEIPCIWTNGNWYW